jgi:hypothetical protein
MKEITISEAEYKELKDYKQMLSMISVYVELFCHEEDTTLMGVIRLLAQYHYLKSEELYQHLDRLDNLNKEDEE